MSTKVEKIPTISPFQKQLSLEEKRHVMKCTQHLAEGGKFPQASLWNKSILIDTLEQMGPNPRSHRNVPLSLSTGKTDSLLEKQ